MAWSIDAISSLYATRGAVQYGMEAVNQCQHALQCAHLAERSGARPELVAAALLHDLGHLVAANGVAVRTAASPATHDRRHEYLALPLLEHLFPPAVLEPIRLHVDAKRYLCHVDAGYWATLSPASQRSLTLQGGPFDAQGAQAFMAQPFAEDAVALRRWDDSAKNPTAATPDWAHYKSLLEKVRFSVTVATPVSTAALIR